MYSHIYNNLDYDTSAIYQIKVKGSISKSLMALLSASVEVTLETSDPHNPVSMLTGLIDDQQELMKVLNLLHQEHHPIVSIACIEVPAEEAVSVSS